VNEQQLSRLAMLAQQVAPEAPAPPDAGAGAIVKALARSARPGERAEEKLIDLGVVDERELALELAAGSGRPFTGLRGFVPDPALFLYIPVATAVQERVCPLVLVGDSLKVASAYLDPDLVAVRTRFPNLELDLVVGMRSEILAALRLVAAPL
jgi:hypothetical protein